MKYFSIPTCPFDEDVQIYSKKKICIKEGVTVLVGCNGAGKSTLLTLIRERLENKNIPFIKYDNLSDGGSNSLSSAIWGGSMKLAASLATSSEGESISINLGTFVGSIHNFLKTGEVDTQGSRLAAAFRRAGELEEEEKSKSNQRWILLDAADSGLSIDNVIDLKDVFNLMIEDAQSLGVELYILISANEYELASESNCFDVMRCKYVKFNDYAEFKDFILETRELKNKRYED